MAYGIWLSYNNQEEGFQIPINPGSIEIGDGSSGKVYDVSGLGEINVIKNPKLTEYSFSSIFPAQHYPFVAAKVLFRPSKYVAYIKKWMGTKHPIRFVFTGDSFDINSPVSIESFNWKEVAGGCGDIEYTLKLKKYVFYAAKKVTVVEVDGKKQLQVEMPERQKDMATPPSYTIVEGDTLWAIAKRFLGNGDRWYEIQSLNAIANDELKNLHIGKTIKLPTEVLA